MSVYRDFGDYVWRYDPPFLPKPHEMLPDHCSIYLSNPAPWSIERLKEHLNLLHQIWQLEQKPGCVFLEPADHIEIIRERITKLEKLEEISQSILKLMQAQRAMRAELESLKTARDNLRKELGISTTS